MNELSMSRRRPTLRVVLPLVIVGTGIAFAAHSATPSTPSGEVSVAQVQTLLDRAPSDPTAHRLLTAYLAGVGETAAVLLDTAEGGGIRCRKTMSLSSADVGRALKVARTVDPTVTAATPFVVRDMLDRAGCGSRP